MSKTIYIGGRLESKEKGNVVTGANAILDDTKGKKQNVINKETDDELLRLEQSKQDNLTFDNAPTEDSTNPVTSGGVYTAEKALSDAIEAILLLIPSAATALNKLVDTNTMNSSISTATATFRGTYNAVSDLGLTYQATHAQIEAALDALGLTADNNDFAFVQIPVSDQSQDIAKTERFKFNGTNWLYEYDLNTSGFTAAQWAAINSGITVALVTKLTDLPTAAALQLALNAKQNTLTFDNEPTALSQNPATSGGIYTAIQAVVTALGGRLDTLEGLIPSEASSSNKLTDKAYVDGLIQAITELIPAEADTTNQLADKAYVLAQILATTPAFKGQFVTLAELQAVASPKAGDLGIVRTKDSDGMDVFTVYQYLNNAWNMFYSLSYHPQVKPSTTGTTGDYPYNGMGRVELAKNIVNDVNTLTQDMFYKTDSGARVPNTNTLFVIQYDYVLGEDIIIPANCVLEFDGGSISASSNNDTITLNNTTFSGENIKFTNITLSGTLTNKTIKLSWVGGSISRLLGIDPTDHVIAFDVDTVADATINYSDKSNIVFDGCNKEVTVGANMKLFLINGAYSNIEVKNFIFNGTTSSSFWDNSSGGVRKNIHIHHNTINTCFLGISLNSDLTGETTYCSVHDNILNCNQIENTIGSYGIHLANANFSNFYNNYVSGCCRHAFYHAWGHDNNIFNNVFENNNIGTDHTTPAMLITRKSENINIYGNKFHENEGCNIMMEHGAPEYDDDQHTIENRRTKGNLRNIDVHDNIIQNDTKQLWFGIMVGYYPNMDYTYIEENIKIHNNIIKTKAGSSININLTSGKNIEIIDNQITWEDSADFETLFASNVVFQFRQDPSLQELAQDILQDFTIKNNILDGPNKTAFSYYPFFMENLREGACFTKGLIKDNVMRGLFEISEHTVVKSNINPTVFPHSYDTWLKKYLTSGRPALTANTPMYEYFDTTLSKPIYWNSTDWVDATGTPV